MVIIRSFLNAIAMYSVFPVRVSGEWKKEDLKYSIVFFPAVGLIIALILRVWFWADGMIGGRNLIFGTLVTAVIPTAISGGIHADGYMDTSDALSSWQGREKKLEILKDSHIGAFAVIRLLMIAALFTAGCSAIADGIYRGSVGGMRICSSWCLGFIFSRILSGISVVNFKNARGSGSLYTFAEAASGAKKTVNICLAAELAFCAAFMITLSPICGCAEIAAGLLIFLHYRILAYNKFGGITGDIAGWFLVRCETWMTLAAAVCMRFIR